jgi:hypothetical protein
MGKKSSFWLKIKYEQNQQLTNTTASNRCGIGQSSAHPLWAREEVFNDPFGYAAASVTTPPLAGLFIMLSALILATLSTLLFKSA